MRPSSASVLSGSSLRSGSSAGNVGAAVIMAAICDIRSMPTRSNSPKMPVLGKPAAAPIARVGLLDRNAPPHGFFQATHHPVAADAIGNEARCILALHHRLAERHVGEAANVVGCARAHVVAGDDFEQLREARRVEEMRDHEIAGEALRHAGGQRCERQRRRIGRDDRAGLAVLVDLAIDVLLDADILLHGLDDPVAISERVQIVDQVAACDGSRPAWVDKARRGAFPLFLDRGLGQRVAVCGSFGNDVQQDHVHPGIGHLRRDAAAHDALRR